MTIFNGRDNDRDGGKYRVIDQFNGALPSRKIFFWAAVGVGALVVFWLVSSFLSRRETDRGRLRGN